MSKSDETNDFSNNPFFSVGKSSEEFKTSTKHPNIDEQRYALHVDPGLNDQSEYSQVGGKRNTNQPYPPSGQQNQDYGQGGQSPFGQSPYDGKNAYPSADGQSGYSQPYGDQYGQGYPGEAGYQQNYDQGQGAYGSQDQYGYDSSNAGAGYGQDYSAYGNADYNSAYQSTGYDQSYAYPDANNPNAGYGDQNDMGDTSFLHNEYPDEGFPEQPAKKSKLPKRLAGVALLVVIGAGLGYAYKTGMFPMGNKSRVAGDGPVFISRDDSPIKERPAEPGGKTFSEGKKAIYGRLEGDDGSASKSQERLESREEKVIETNNNAGQGNNDAVPGITVGSTIPPQQERAQEGSGGVQTVKTLQVRPDGSIVNNVPGISMGGFPDAPKRTERIGITGQAFNSDSGQQSADNSGAQRSQDSGQNNIGSGIEPIRAKSADRVPSAPPPQREEPQRTASLTPERIQPSAPVQREEVSPDAGGGSGFAIQVAARRDEGDALAAFADIQQKYPNVLATYRPLIQRADLSAQGKGVWYRLRIGPMDSKAAATSVCQQLKDRGHGACFVSKL